MACVERVKRLLEQNQVSYEVIPHREAFTSQEVAETSHVPGRRLAKVVVLREAKGAYLMAVLPAREHIDLPHLQRESGRPGVAMAAEDEIQRLFPDCEVGAMPPFGNLYQLPMYLDACFRGEEDFYFQAGNHHEVVKLKFKDFERLVQPLAGESHLHEARKAERV